MSIINALPGIQPTARPYTMGQWAQKSIKMRNGRNVRWGLSSRQSRDRIELTWENITFAQAELLSAVWDANYGITGDLTLQPETLAGASGNLAALLAQPFPNTTWCFAGSPQITAVKAGRCTVRMQIKTRFGALPGFRAGAGGGGGAIVTPQYVFGDIYNFGLAEPGNALVAPQVECPEGCATELRLVRLGNTIVTNLTSFYVLGTNDIANGEITVRWQSRCNCPGNVGNWTDAADRGGNSLAYPTYAKDPWEPPGKESERYWQVNILQFGPVSPLGGWLPANIDMAARITGPEFDYLPPGGGPAIRAVPGEVLQDEQVVATGSFFLSEKWVYVAASRYRMDNGPWINGPDFTPLL